MNGKFYNQSKNTPKSFLTGIPFKPNDGKLKRNASKVKCLISTKMNKQYMSEKNSLYFDNKEWIKTHQNSKFKDNNRNNSSIGLNMSFINRDNKNYNGNKNVINNINNIYGKSINSSNTDYSSSKIHRPNTSTNNNNYNKDYININNSNINNNARNNNKTGISQINTKLKPEISKLKNSCKNYSLYSVKTPSNKDDSKLILKQYNRYSDTTYTSRNTEIKLNQREINKLILNNNLENRIYKQLSRPKSSLNIYNSKNKNNNKRSFSKKEIYDLSYKNKHRLTPTLHKEYGQIPDYLVNSKIRTGIEKEYENIIKEESYFPLGTNLLDEEERIKYLKELRQVEMNLTSMLRSLPISVEVRSQGLKFRKIVLERKLQEVEDSIKKLSLSKVFVSKQ